MRGTSWSHGYGGYEETHACNYLLANDMEMQPVPGYTGTSWSHGKAVAHSPRQILQRQLQRLADASAMVICDVFDHQ
ncbi:hypothetical protein EWM58_14595, partial [Candidatus Erwinia dacicola]|nr:hypothetical protein [Candidatus Erwinia dacicola]